MKRRIFAALVLLMVSGSAYFFWPQEKNNLYIGASQQHVDHRGWVIEIDPHGEEVETIVHDVLNDVKRTHSMDIDEIKDELYVGGEGGIEVIDLKTRRSQKSFKYGPQPIRNLRVSPTTNQMFISNPQPPYNEIYTWIIDTKSDSKVGGLNDFIRNEPAGYISQKEYFEILLSKEKFPIKISRFSLQPFKLLMDKELYTHEEVKESGGLYPPGNNSNHPYTYIRDDEIIFLNREDAKKLATIGLKEEIVGYGGNWINWGNGVVINDETMTGFVGIISDEGNLLEIDMENLEIKAVHDVEFDLPKHAGPSTNMVIGPPSGR